MPFACKLCRGRFCVEHRLPENHACVGLADYRARPREGGGVLYRSPHEETPRAGPARLRLGPRVHIDRAFARLDGKVTYILLGVIVGVFLLELLILGFAGDATFARVFLLSTDVLTRPWTVLTSILAHDPGNFNHIFANSLVLFFFGRTLEGILGSKRFLGLFFAAGVVAGLAEVWIFGSVLGRPIAVLGASGAIMGVMGALTVLAPRLTVLVFFVIPAPLWLLTALYALLDIALLGAGDNVARLAHLAGLALGLGYGKWLHDQGMRVRVARAPAQRGL